MTSFIDVALDQNNYPGNQKLKSRTQSFFLSCPKQISRVNTSLSNYSYSLTFSSENYQNQIQYITVFDFFQTHISIKIIPCDFLGKHIRCKEIFNKNGWIRKNINQNKNKFLKINPLTGEIFFTFSFFLYEEIHIRRFWKDLFEKLSQVQKQLEWLLGKSKFQNNVEKLIETEKLIFQIKLAQRFGQNIQIKEQFNRMNFQKSQKVDLSQGYSTKESLMKYNIQPKPELLNKEPSKNLQNVVKEYDKAKQIIKNAISKNGISNKIQLLITPEMKKQLQKKIKERRNQGQFMYKITKNNQIQTIKVQIVQRKDLDNLEKVKVLLDKIIKDFEQYRLQNVSYNFLDNYFIQTEFKNVIMTLARKQIGLEKFLQRNFYTISYETKFRILIQVLNCITTLWRNHKITVKKINIRYFTIDKSSVVKLKNIQLDNIEKKQRFDGQQVARITLMRKRMLKELCRIYFQIFFNRKIIGVPGKKQTKQKIDEFTFSSLNQIAKLYYPNNLYTLIVGLNYFFIKLYFNYFQDQNEYEKFFKPKGSQDNNKNQQFTEQQKIKNENSKQQKYSSMFNEIDRVKQQQQQQQKLKYIDRARKGAPRLDILSSMCIIFIEEHQNKLINQAGQI